MLFIDEKTEKLINSSSEQRSNPFNYPVGVTTYENFYSHQELCEIESNIEQTEKKCKQRAFLPMTAQQTFSRQQNFENNNENN